MRGLISALFLCSFGSGSSGVERILGKDEVVSSILISSSSEQKMYGKNSGISGVVFLCKVSQRGYCANHGLKPAKRATAHKFAKSLGSC